MPHGGDIRHTIVDDDDDSRQTIEVQKEVFSKLTHSKTVSPAHSCYSWLTFKGMKPTYLAW